MRHQVTATDYQRCVTKAAVPPPVEVRDRLDRPAVQVSWRDASAYASWLSRRTGGTYRLPTDEEWAFAAGSRFMDDSVGGRKRIPRTAGSRATTSQPQTAHVDEQVKPAGTFGVNEHGLRDMAGNVWEWTNTCYVRTAL